MSRAESLTVLDGEGVQALLAHRFPFLLVDSIEILEPGKRVRGHKRLSTGEWWAEGGSHFPHTLVIEALAQTSGAIVEHLAEGTAGAVAYFMGVDRVRLRAMARIGDELTLDLTLRQWRRGICRTHGVASVGGNLVASASLTTIVRGGAPTPG